ncbi:MAG: extracellular matrix regulator RemB [Phascolarctobacterium sp.]
MVKNSEIIAILDVRHPQSLIYSDYVEKYRGRYKVVDAAEGEDYASIILTEETLYLSAISALTLKKRADAGFLAGACYTNL